MSKRFKLWGGLVAVLVIIIGVVFWQVNQTDLSPELSDQTTENDKSAGIFDVREDDWTRGNPDADVVVIKYSDFGCPACLNYASMDHRLVSELGDSVLFVFRHFPLPGSPASKMAARYAEAAGRQGKFWPMHNIIYSNQQNWRTGNVNATMMFRQMAEHLELDMEQMDEDVMDPEIEEKIQRNYEMGVEAKVTGVPAVFINGQKMPYNPDMEGYRAQIESFLE